MQAFIGLGSNLDQPAQRLISALHALQRLPGIDLLSPPDIAAPRSALRTNLITSMPSPGYRSTARPTNYFTPSGPGAGRWPPTAGTGASARWIWISCYWTASTSAFDLHVPHPQMTCRAFVLQPLLEIAPGALLPDGTALSSFLEEVAEQAVTPMSELDRDALIE